MKPSHVPYLRHNLARFNAEAKARRRTPWLGLCALVVWSGGLWWVASRECEYRHQRERALTPTPSVSTGLSGELSHQSEHYGARIVNETPSGLSLEL